MAAASNVKKGPQVFINFRGEDLRRGLASQLDAALKLLGINSFIDEDLNQGEELNILFDKIEQSTVAVAFLSSGYTNSDWCLNELIEIKKCVDRDTLRVFPVFYKLEPSIVQSLDGDFGLQLWNLWRNNDRDNKILKWDAALQSVVTKKGLIFQENSEEREFIKKIIQQIMNYLDEQLKEENHKPRGREEREEGPDRAVKSIKPGEKFLKQLEEKLGMDCNDNETRIVGLVGMPGIGKTYLANELSKKLKQKISRSVFIEGHGLDKLKLQKKLVEDLLKIQRLSSDNENVLEVWKSRLSEKKVAVVIDNVRNKEQVDALLGNREWIKGGSRIVITTRDKSLLKGQNCELCEVPKMNYRDSFELFRAQICATLGGNFVELSRKFLDFAGGNPSALKEFAQELYGKDEDHWKTRLGTLTKQLGKELRICYDELNEKQKDVFLDIAYFFRSQEETYVRSLLDFSDPKSAGEELKDLADKFLIGLCDSRVEMHDLFFTMAKELAEATSGKYRLLSSNRPKWTSVLANQEGIDKVRGVVLDMSNMEEMPLDNLVFLNMSSLLYLKVYNSDDSCDNHEAGCKLNLTDGVEFPKDNNVRYLHWTNFPMDELPSNFEPKNLIDLKLPHSKITKVWKGAKVTPKLKWVDLRHSSNLDSLSSLSEAPNLLRLNLEGCTSLKELPKEMKEMKNLTLLNLRGCTSLLSLPPITINSLKTLILSGCSNFHTFKVISTNLEKVYLNGTAISGLPSAIGTLHKLLFLNLKDCKNLANLPYYLGDLKNLQELNLSHCSKLKVFPNVKKNLVNLRILLLDGTSISEMPIITAPSLSFVQRLCLSGNDKIRNLQFNSSHLKWLELKYCKNLKSLQLPPNLRGLDAHGCTSLQTVSLALPMPTEDIHSTLSFTNCHELEEASKNGIISYVQKKGKMMSNVRYNLDFVFNSLIGTCFPGSEVPMWFLYKADESVLKVKLPRDRKKGRLNGVVICVVVSFEEIKYRTNTLQVKCTCEFSDHANIKLKRVSFIVGGWSEQGDDEPKKIKSDHIFIGYNSWFDTNTLQKEEHEKEYVPNEISLRFEVTNGSSEVAECKVKKCGFSLSYESDETVSWEVL